MNTSSVLVLAFAIGVIAGLRSLTAPAVVSWAAHWGWLDLTNSRLAFLGSTTAAIIFSLLALGELVADKLPFAPNRTAALGLGTRIVTGGLSAAAIFASA